MPKVASHPLCNNIKYIVLLLVYFANVFFWCAFPCWNHYHTNMPNLQMFFVWFCAKGSISFMGGSHERRLFSFGFRYGDRDCSYKTYSCLLDMQFYFLFYMRGTIVLANPRIPQCGGCWGNNKHIGGMRFADWGLPSLPATSVSPYQPSMTNRGEHIRLPWKKIGASCYLFSGQSGVGTISAGHPLWKNCSSFASFQLHFVNLLKIS